MEEKLQRFLEGRHVASFGCTRPDGTVHVTPVWYLWEDGALWVPTSSQCAKGRYVKARPHATLMIDSRERGPLRGALASGPTEIVGGAQAKELNERIGYRYMSPEAMADPRVAAPMAERDDVTIRIAPERWDYWDMEEWFGGILETPGYLLPLSGKG
jgi:PPOX class probable F420-dependent enzyme